MLYAGVLFFLVLQFLRPQEFIPIIRGAPLVFFTMIVLLPVWLVTLQWKRLLRTPADLFTFFFYLICILSYWNYWKTHMYLPAIEFGKIFLCYLFVVHVIDTRRKLTGAVWMTMLTLLVVAMMAGDNVGLPGQYASIGMFDNRNDFAYAMAIMLPLAFAFFMKGDPFSKVVSVAIIVVGIAETFATGSRGGMLASIFAVGTIFYMLAKSKLGRTIMLTAGIVALVAAFMMSSRLGSIGGYREDKSSMGRVEIWAQCLSMFKQHAILGWGRDTWDKLGKAPRDTHSTYMRALVELGVTGLFIYIGLIFFTLREAHRLAREAAHPTLRLLAIGLTGVMVGHIVASLFQTRLYHMFILVLFAMISALRLIADRERWEQQEPLEPLAASPSPEPPGLWERSAGPGLVTRGLVFKKDLKIIAALTFACWLAHKLFVMKSY